MGSVSIQVGWLRGAGLFTHTSTFGGIGGWECRIKGGVKIMKRMEREIPKLAWTERN